MALVYATYVWALTWMSGTQWGLDPTKLSSPYTVTWEFFGLGGLRLRSGSPADSISMKCFGDSAEF